MEMNFTPGENEKDALKKYARNLNDEILSHKSDPIIGRDDEIRRLIEILSRKTKNNPVLIGEPGVGKTAIVEGFAQRIVNGDVPEQLKDKEIYELSLTSIMAGASFQGMFEQRMNAIIKQVKDSDGKIILFIDEIHQLVGMGKSGDGSMDAANILKPMMARGEIKIIGATTLDEYRKYIEKDAALERRMQKIIVNEPSVQEALTIMRGLKDNWELFHQVKIHDNALIAAVTLSDRYITDKFLPDKAIDLIDEAAARVKTEMHSSPAELDKAQRELIHKKTERASLLKETDEQSKKRLSEIDQEIEVLESKEKKLKTTWESKKNEHDKINQLKQELEKSKHAVEKFQMDGQYEKASKLLYTTIPALEKDIAMKEKEFNEANDSFSNAVTSKEVAEVISKATGIKVNKLVEDEKTKLLQLDKQLMTRVKGQDEACKLVANAVLRGRAGINDPNRPIGSFLFMGPTGTGKTELAKSLAYYLFDTEKAMIRIDMSEFMEKHAVSKLIGTSAGYVGYDDAGILSETVRRKPYSVVLFDEIEKAHPDVLNILLQILDDGMIHDGKGKLINFKNTIIILTTNIGASYIMDNNKKEALDELKKYMRPELINRIDEIVTFNPIGNDTTKQISIKLLDELAARISKEGYLVKFNDKVAEKVAKDGYDASMGARPLKRFVQKNIENTIANEILSGSIKKGTSYEATLDQLGMLILKTKENND